MDPPLRLPNGFLTFENQVAGHDAKDGKSVTGLLSHNDGTVLKPLIKQPQSDCEVSFYETIQKGEIGLRDFTPKYEGVVKVPINNREVTFLKLQDVTCGLAKPCIMDVKIGARTWAPNASAAKRQLEDEKYRSSKQEFSFCIPGYQVHDISTKTLIKMTKEKGKLLNKETLPIAVKEFLNSEYSSHLIDHFLVHLRKMLDWWKVQTDVHIYSSSILCVYDAFELEHFVARGSPQNITPPSWIRVFMIDFAHVVPANNQLDYNYIQGLSNFIKLFEQINQQ